MPAALLKAAFVGLIAVPLLAPAEDLSAAPVSAPFAVEKGDTFSYRSRYLRTALIAGQPSPVISIDYDLELKITGIDGDVISATVRNSGMNISVDGQRVLSPPDFDSLIYLAVDGMSAELDVAKDGGLIRVANWDSGLKDDLIERARTLAGDDDVMIATVDAFLPNVSPVDAVQFFARPLAIAAPGRVVSFDPPERTTVTADDIELPSFATYAGGRWSFDLIPRADIPDSITVEWIGVPSPEGLKAILAPITEQMAETTPLTDEERAEIEENSKLWQRFAATYDDEGGELVEFQGLMELHAGDLIRRAAIETRIKNR